MHVAGRRAARRARPPLTAEQEAALRGDPRRAAPGEGLLLHGVTGSGKTEVYLRAAAETLERGRDVIVLVPEIALTPQIVARFVERFGDTVAVLHSKLSRRRAPRRVGAPARAARRASASARARRCSRRCRDVGLDRRRRGARLAPTSTRATRATTRGASRCAGRASPGAVLVARQRDAAAGERPGAARALRLPARVDGQSLPPVEIVDMREARRALHPATHEALAAARQGDRAAQPPRLVELPDVPVVRAGVGVPVVRRDARDAPRATACSPATTAATASASRRAARTAARCRSRATGRAPSASRHELDVGGLRCSASTPTWATRRRCWPRFQAAPRGVLVGTQMVAKGHDFPDVDLGVVARRRRHAALPRLPRRGADVRARDPARGPRRPRGAGGGRVLVQTLAPEARVDRARGAPRRGHVRRRGARAARARCATRRSRRSSGSSARRSRPGAARRPRRRCARASRAARRAPRSARRRCSACAAASARRSWSRRRERGAAVAAIDAAVQAVAGDRAFARRELQRGRRSAVAPRRRRRYAAAATPMARIAAPRHGRAECDGSREVSQPDRTSRSSARARPRARRAPRRGARPRPEVRRSRAAVRRPGRSRSSTRRCATRSRAWARSCTTRSGIGLAATQVGRAAPPARLPRRARQPGQRPGQPGLEWSGKDEEWMEEGCLSLPRVHVDVERPIHVRVRAQDAARRADPRSRRPGSRRASSSTRSTTSTAS